jgi:uncharacterized protein
MDQTEQKSPLASLGLSSQASSPLFSEKKHKIYDSVHGFIRFNDLERDLIDSPVFQRLHFIHQLGMAYLVYPGATHTRFEHSLGAMELASQIFDRVTSKETFSAGQQDYCYWKQVLRFAALCHDLGHLPFSHVAEKALLGKGGHEKWTLEIIKSKYLAPIWQEFEQLYSRTGAEADIIKISIGEKKLEEIAPGAYSFTPWERVVSQMICGDFFGADRIDYLLRDAQCTGVSYGLFDYHQLIEMLCILPKGANELELGIEENGIESCEALLLARYFMHKRVYQYYSVKAYSFHLSRFMQKVFHWISSSGLESYLSCTENEVMTALHLAAKEEKSAGHKDAYALLRRKQRFKAVQLPDDIEDSFLQSWKQEAQAAEDSAFWDLTSKKKRPLGLLFPVLKRNQKIVDASALSKILIPLDTVSWAYVSPEYETSLHQAIEKR